MSMSSSTSMLLNSKLRAYVCGPDAVLDVGSRHIITPLPHSNALPIPPLYHLFHIYRWCGVYVYCDVNCCVKKCVIPSNCFHPWKSMHPWKLHLLLLSSFIIISCVRWSFPWSNEEADTSSIFVATMMEVNI